MIEQLTVTHRFDADDETASRTFYRRFKTFDNPSSCNNYDRANTGKCKME